MNNLFDGFSSEKLVEAHFCGWKWTTAKPGPDLGSDLLVEVPASSRGDGAAFALQVRSGNRWKSSETIGRSSAERLKASSLPAFLLFVHRLNREARWTDLEPLLDFDPSFRDGGDLKVPLSQARSFPLLSADPDLSFLVAVRRAKGRGAMKAAGSLGGLARAIHDHYARLDPALVVSPSFVDGQDVMNISARHTPVSLRMTIRDFVNGSDAAFRDAIEWGRKATIEARDLTITGSPLFEYLSSQRSPTTRIEVRPMPIWEGRGILLTLGSNERPPHTEIVDVRMTRGTEGGEIVVIACAGLLELNLRVVRSSSSVANFCLHYDVLRRSTFNELSRAMRVWKVLSGVFEGEAVELELDDFHTPGASPIRFHWHATPSDSMEDLTFPIRAAMALTYVAKTQDWQIVGCPMQYIRGSDMDRWLAAEKLLRDGRVELPPREFSLSSAEELSLGNGSTAFGNVVMPHSFDVPLAGELLGQLPAWVRFRNYHAIVEEPSDDGLWKLRFSPGEGATFEYLAPSDEHPEF